MGDYHQMLSEAAEAAGGQLSGPDAAYDGVSTDTRNIKPGQLFVALKGPNFDGHDYVQDALNKGAAGVMISHALEIDVPQIIVSDTQWALGQLAIAWRNHFSIPFVAVTGSNGKTTVKEMITSILLQQGTVLSTRGNFNNELGVPLTLLQLNTSHDSAVIEEGARHQGDIAYLTKLVKPTVAVVTNAAGAHLEGFGSLEVVANTKGELFENLPENGIAIINADDQYAAMWKSMAGKRDVITFGINADADVKGELQETHNCIGCVLKINSPIGDCVVSLLLPGQHNAMNALAATAASIAVGIELDVIKKGLEAVKPVPGRLQWKNGVNNARILDDTYNANPSSLAAALNVLSECPGDHYLALGDMAELGAETKGYHQQAGRQARSSGVHRLYAVGEYARYAVEAFGDQAWHFSRQEQLVDQLREDLTADVTLLVKGSRSAHMDKVVEALEMHQAVGSTG